MEGVVCDIRESGGDTVGTLNLVLGEMEEGGSEANKHGRLEKLKDGPRCGASKCSLSAVRARPGDC